MATGLYIVQYVYSYMNVDARIIDAIRNGNTSMRLITKFVDSSQRYVNSRLIELESDGMICVDRTESHRVYTMKE